MVIKYIIYYGIRDKCNINNVTKTSQISNFNYIYRLIYHVKNIGRSLYRTKCNRGRGMYCVTECRRGDKSIINIPSRYRLVLVR